LGWTTSAPQSISIHNCNQCKSGSFADLVTGSCITFSVGLPSIIIPLLIFLAVVVIIRIRCSAAVQGSLIIKTSEITFPVPEKILGRGSGGIVIQAQHRGTPIAIKFFTKDEATALNHDVTHLTLSSQIGGRQLSSRQAVIEIKLLSEVRHPCITTFMGAVPLRQGGFAWVMELMELGGLRDLLQNQMFEYDAEFTLQVLCNISQGMLFLHEAQPPILHRDLKSSNVLVDCNFRAKLSDIKMSEQQGISLEGKSLLWTAPECLHDRDEYSKASDAYSFGVVLYECLHRSLPYEGDDVHAVLESLYDSDGKQHRLRPPQECSVEISALMNECLSFSSAHRPFFREIDRRLAAMTPRQVQTKAMTTDGDTRQKGLGWNRAKHIKSIVPSHLMQAIGRGEKIPPESKEMVTMYFSDIVGFTDLSASMSAEKVGMMLDRLFDMLDDAAEANGVAKVETIGDAYLCVSNLHGEHNGDHAARMARFALAAIQCAAATPIDTDDPSRGQVQMRVGLHSGPCIAGIIGKHNPKYTLFGDTINVAARMEQNGRPGKIQCSAFTAGLIKSQDASITLLRRGLVEVKGKGSMETFWIIDSSVSSSHDGNLHRLSSSNSSSSGLHKESSNMDSFACATKIPITFFI
jgi:guanylate cyclase, other